VVSDRRRLLAELSPRGQLDDIAAEVDWAATRGLDPASYTTAARREGRRPAAGVEDVARILDDYATLKRRRGIADLDDLLSSLVAALERDPGFGDATRWRFRHLLVDEAQDLNPLQHRIVDLLRHGTDDVFLVGDPAQAIYGFNGADPSLLVDVDARFPGIEIVRLRANHRCTPQVVDVGVHVLRSGGQPAELESARPDGPSVRVVPCDDESDEIARVVDSVRRIDPALVRRTDVAVLARTHGQLAALRAGLERGGVPLRRRLDGPSSPYGPAVAAATRLGSADRLRSWAHDVLDGLDEPGTPDDAAGRAVPEQDDARRCRCEVAETVLDFLREEPLGNGAEFRTWLGTGEPLGIGDEPGIDLLTFHAAKGREWHTVFVTGVETGLVPHRSATTAGARAEEARLLYVALTRAADELVVSWARRRGGYQRRRSPLLDGYEPLDAAAVAPPRELLTTDDADPTARAHAALVEWRARVARATNTVPEAVCATSLLRRIAEHRPATADELDELTGVGRLTARRWWPALEPILRSADAAAAAS
jgi:DNA helicase-2/ATP-dependent DNA helicase PcrA